MENTFLGSQPSARTDTSMAEHLLAGHPSWASVPESRLPRAQRLRPSHPGTFAVHIAQGGIGGCHLLRGPSTEVSTAPQDGLL